MSCYAATAVALLVPFAVYLTVRMASAAYFRSKREHESQLTRKD